MIVTESKPEPKQTNRQCASVTGAGIQFLVQCAVSNFHSAVKLKSTAMSVAVVQVQVQVQVVQVRYCSSALVQMQCTSDNLGRSRVQFREINQRVVITLPHHSQ